MTIGMFANLLIAIVTLWLSLACLIGAVRFSFHPLAIEGIGMLLISVPFVVELVLQTRPAFTILMMAVGLLVSNGYRLLNQQKYQTARQQRGITLRKLLFFARQ
jgi:hypothetical protein